MLFCVDIVLLYVIFHCILIYVEIHLYKTVYANPLNSTINKRGIFFIIFLLNLIPSVMTIMYYSF